MKPVPLSSPWWLAVSLTWMTGMNTLKLMDWEQSLVVIINNPALIARKLNFLSLISQSMIYVNPPYCNALGFEHSLGYEIFSLAQYEDLWMVYESDKKMFDERSN